MRQEYKVMNIYAYKLLHRVTQFNGSKKINQTKMLYITHVLFSHTPDNIILQLEVQMNIFITRLNIGENANRLAPPRYLNDVVVVSLHVYRYELITRLIDCFFHYFLLPPSDELYYFAYNDFALVPSKIVLHHYRSLVVRYLCRR